MRVLLQRVAEASVTVADTRISAIDHGLLLLVGVTDSDSEQEAVSLAAKVAKLRIFEDAEGKMNLSLLDTGGEALVVSQFTLYADARKGRRPSFINAARPPQAEPLVQTFADELSAAGIRVQMGQFGAEMAVGLINDGPVTIWLDSAEL